MERALPRPLDWRPFAWVALWTVNAILLAVTLSAFLYADVGVDWAIFTEAGQRFFTGDLYEWDGLPYRYSPVLAPLFLVTIGFVGWSALHFVALLALPRKVALITLLSFPFWNDVYNGNTMTFVFVAAFLTVSDSRWGAYAFAALALLTPRPVMLPVLAWLLWRHREYVLPFGAMFVVHTAAVWATGWGPEWITHLLETGPQDIYVGHDLGPSQWFGLWWYPVGLALAGWLTWKGRLGLASIAVLPFWLPHYFIMGLLELSTSEHRRRNDPASIAS